MLFLLVLYKQERYQIFPPNDFDLVTRRQSRALCSRNELDHQGASTISSICHAESCRHVCGPKAALARANVAFRGAEVQSFAARRTIEYGQFVGEKLLFFLFRSICF